MSAQARRGAARRQRAPALPSTYRIATRSCHPGRRSVHCRASAGGGSGTVEKPGAEIDFSKLNSILKKKPPLYRVLLHNDNTNRREYVVQALLKVVDGLTMENAIEVMHEAHNNDVALVTVAAQEQAEEYVTGLRRNGLTSTLEPIGGGGSSGEGE